MPDGSRTPAVCCVPRYLHHRTSLAADPGIFFFYHRTSLTRVFNSRYVLLLLVLLLFGLWCQQRAVVYFSLCVWCRPVPLMVWKPREGLSWSNVWRV